MGNKNDKKQESKKRKTARITAGEIKTRVRVKSKIIKLRIAKYESKYTKCINNNLK